MKKLIPALLLLSFMISFLGFTSNDNNTKSTYTFDTKKFIKAVNELSVSSPLNKMINSSESKSAIVENNWSDDARKTLVSAGFNPDKFHPQEIFGTQTKEYTMPMDSITDAMSVRTYNGQSTGSNYGYSVSSAGDVNGDGYADIIVGAPGYSSNTGRAYIYYGGLIPHYTPDVVLNGEAVDNYFGSSVSTAGDVNGDGYSDVIVGAYGYSSYTGRAYIYYGGVFMNNVFDVIMTGGDVFDTFGVSVSTAGDVNGDGYADVIVGANGYSSGTGRAYIYYGGASMDNVVDLTMTGEAVNNSFGSSVSTAGDVNGDGYSDVIVGAFWYSSNTGRAYIYYGGASMNNIADVIMTGETTENYFGNSVSTAGDVNGDGYSDVIVGAFGFSSNTGRAYIYFGGVSMNNVADVILTGEAVNNYFGRSVSTAGDVNGDGYSDIIIGAQFAYSSLTGKVYIYYGGPSMDNVADVTMTGEAANNFFGNSVSSAGDVNGDGYSDVIVGAIGYSSNTGRAYVYIQSMTGPDIPDLSMIGEASGNFFGYAVSSAGDVNGDGYADVIVGAYNYNSGQGRAYIYYGGVSMNNVADVIMTGEGINNFFGISVSTAGDVNGDGYSDVIVGANMAGKSYIYYGGASMDNVADIILTGESGGDNFGCSVSTAGDVNGDGYSDVIVGASGNLASSGRAYIYYGGASMDNVADVILTGEATNNLFGISVSDAGDVNGDGYSDVIVGATEYSSYTGRAYIFYGGASMDNIADVTMTGEATSNWFGLSVSTAGDVNGDGYADVIIGAPYYNTSQGRAYIYYGGQSMNNVADVTMTGEAAGNYFGYSVATASDVNGDGFSDVIVGAKGYSSNTGRAYIYFGGASMDNGPDVIMTGEAANNNFGNFVSTAGDVNGDGYPDAIVGAPSIGKAYVYITSTPPVKPTLISVKDVPNEQGGKVNLTWAKSGYDVNPNNNISFYSVERKITPASGWEMISTVTPSHYPLYSYIANTPFDSGNGQSGMILYRIVAKTSSVNVYWISNTKYGYSVDNIPPLMVKNLAGNMDTSKINLHWKHNTDTDLAKYRIYRNDLLIAEKTDTTLNDLSVLADSTYKYRVAAVDIHGNEGPKSDSLQFTFSSPSINLSLTALLSGHFNGTTMVPKNVKVELHNSITPYALVDSQNVLLNTSGIGNPQFTKAANGTSYYILLKFDNGLETWSAAPQTFSGSSLIYDFTSAATQAYGSNLILVGTKWCIISGDANQDGSVDALDRSACWNDRNVAGTYLTDFNGDGVVDALDRSIAWNNRNLSVQKPALVAIPGAKQDNKGEIDNSKGTKDLKLDGSNAKKVKQNNL